MASLGYEVHCTLGDPHVHLLETWFGDAEPYRGGTRLIVRVGPACWNGFGGDGQWGLVFEGDYTPGSMVLRTERTCVNERPIPKGPPERVVDISFDSTPGGSAWRQQAKGSWPCRLTRIRRRTVWDRLRTR